MEAEVSDLAGTERGGRTENRATYRNGYRSWRWDTHAGEIELLNWRLPHVGTRCSSNNS